MKPYQQFIGYMALLLTSCTSVPLGLERGTWLPLRHTLKELRDMHVVKQQEEYSCGAAALATLLTFYFGDSTSEREILTLLENPLSEEEKKTKSTHGFSLLDLKQVAQTKGYRAAGFKLSFSEVVQLKAPVIVFLEPLGYKHFAVYRGFDRGRIYLADPARGNLRMSMGRFLDEWKGIIFVLGKDTERTIEEHPLSVPNPLYVQPELARMNGHLDIGMILRMLPQ